MRAHGHAQLRSCGLRLFNTHNSYVTCMHMQLSCAFTLHMHTHTRTRIVALMWVAVVAHAQAHAPPGLEATSHTLCVNLYGTLGVGVGR
jgi:hypothetical protein